MIGRLRAFLSGPAADAAGPDRVLGDPPAQAFDGIHALDLDPYLHVADDRLNLISVFDDLKYDRADADMMTGPMRSHAFAKLAPMGFRQTAGTVLTHREEDRRILVPKFHALGASPFDIARYTPKRAQDYYLLTPTQTACRFVDTYPLDDAVERIKALIAKHPINLYRMLDYLEHKPAHDAFRQAIGHLKFVQTEAVASEPLCRRRALG